MNFVDEENFAFVNVAEDADQVQLLLQHRTGGLLNSHAQFRGDDAGERGLTQARRAVEQHMIHGFAALLRGFDRDGEIFLDFGLAGEIGQTDGPQRGFELPLLFAKRRRNDALFPHEVSVYAADRDHSDTAPVLTRGGTSASKSFGSVADRALRHRRLRQPRGPHRSSSARRSRLLPPALKALLGARRIRPRGHAGRDPACRAAPAPCAPRFSCRRRESAPVARPRRIESPRPVPPRPCR